MSGDPFNPEIGDSVCARTATSARIIPYNRSDFAFGWESVLTTGRRRSAQHSCPRVAQRLVYRRVCNFQVNDNLLVAPTDYIHSAAA